MNHDPAVPPLAADLVVRQARQLLTCAGPAPRAGAAQREVGCIPGGALAAREGRIVFVGPSSDCERLVVPTDGATLIDAAGATIIPGFVDAHTHLVYAGDRREELRRRLAGVAYAQIAAEGGGIVATVGATRAATEEDLAASAAGRLAEMLALGTTTAEVKSGYGLETATELKMLRVVRHLAAAQPVDLVATFLGAHEIPAEYRANRQGYIDLLVTEMIPAVAREHLAEWCDVFCETGVYTPEESEMILRAGIAAGLQARIHADELAASGGSAVAARVGARSADHLLFADEAAAAGLAEAGVVATLLPAAALYLKLARFAPARMLIDHGVPVALASDINPGGGFSASMPFQMTLACFAMHMTAEEALVAATLNGAYALDRHHSVGSLEVGKQADAVIVNGDLVDLLRVGRSRIETVIKRGEIVAGRGLEPGTP